MSAKTVFPSDYPYQIRVYLCLSVAFISSRGFCERRAVAAVMNASNSGANSPVRQKFSGCHCTPTQNAEAGRSMASTMPSEETAVTTNSGATRPTDW